VKTVADTLGVARSNLAVQANTGVPAPRRGRPAKPETELLAEIKKIIAGQPTYGYRRVHALIRRRRQQQGGGVVNVKRVYRIMKVHGLLLERHTGAGEERRHDGRVAVNRPDTRWCSDGFEIGCDNGERVRIAFTLDCCDREAISWVATTGGINSGDVRDLMIESVERRFGLVNRLPVPIEWLSDNGSPYTARETRALAREVGLVPCTTPIESPQSTDVIDKGIRERSRVAVPFLCSVVRAVSPSRPAEFEGVAHSGGQDWPEATAGGGLVLTITSTAPRFAIDGPLLLGNLLSRTDDRVAKSRAGGESPAAQP
jgi:putative transposase